MSNESSDFALQPSKPPSLLGTIFLILFAAPFAGLGLFALAGGIWKLWTGNWDDGPRLCQVGLAFSGFSSVFIFLPLWSRKKARQAAKLRAHYADKLWMLRPDWAAGKIKATVVAPRGFLWMLSVLALALSAPIVWIIPAELHNHNYAILMTLLFPFMAFSWIGYSLVQWRRRRRFGACFFELAHIPIPLGGTVDGLIQLGGRLRLEHGLNLKLACIRRVIINSGNGNDVQEKVLWQEEKAYKNEMALPEPEPGHTGIPVFFQLPAGRPQCFARDNVSVVWRLEARAKLSGPDFHVRFDLPVFKVAGASSPVRSSKDPTAQWQAPMDEIRRNENSRIKIFDGSSGREFYFPPGRCVSMALVLTTFFLIWSSFLAISIHHLATSIMIGLGFFEIVLFVTVFLFWFKSSRVIINSTEVRVTKRYLIFSHTRRFAAGDVARFGTKPGMQFNSQIFTDIRLIRRGADEKFAGRSRLTPSLGDVNRLARERMREAAGPRGVTVGGSVADSMEAEWLAREMNRALGRKV